MQGVGGGGPDGSHASGCCEQAGGWECDASILLARGCHPLRGCHTPVGAVPTGSLGPCSGEGGTGPCPAEPFSSSVPASRRWLCVRLGSRGCWSRRTRPSVCTCGLGHWGPGERGAAVQRPLSSRGHPPSPRVSCPVGPRPVAPALVEAPSLAAALSSSTHSPRAGAATRERAPHDGGSSVAPRTAPARLMGTR